MEQPTSSLPDHLLELADSKGLVIEDGAILFDSEVGGGLLAHSWLTQQESGICISTEILSPIAGTLDEYEELMSAVMSKPIDEEVAVGVIERWGLLQQLELSFDAQLARKHHAGKEHDSGFTNDNLDITRSPGR